MVVKNQYFSTKSNDLGIILFSQKTMFYLMKANYAIFSIIKVTKLELLGEWYTKVIEIEVLIL